MSWLTEVVRPKIKALISKKQDIPENLWSKCPKCEHMIFHRDLVANHYVCTHCQHHMRLDAKDRLNLLFDNQQYRELDLMDVKQDPLNFKDSKKYSDRLKTYR
ncbi:MAG: acetyl-CoA carboxylase carboxyl transferase subunit beta, partial [Alphaproteobacteria bacterium]|nr:acetyl-CoA carboxylase carboxyl transferase subunit beta [Alphaproteobacteria bacterium]